MPPFDGWMVTDRRDDAENRFPIRSWRYWFRYDESIWLIYLGFWFIQPALGHEPLGRWLLLFLALGLFLPFYLFSHRGPLRFRRLFVLGMFLLAMLYVPFNQTAWGIFIYIAASIPEVSDSINTVIALLLLESAVIFAESWLLHLSPWVWTMGIGFTLFVGMNRLRMRQKNKADAKLRMAHEEMSNWPRPPSESVSRVICTISWGILFL
jgi:hypothetical protein